MARDKKQPRKPGAKFAQVQAGAIMDRALSAEALRVLCMIALYAFADRTAWPSVATLAHHLGLDRRTVQRHLAQIEARGHLHRERRLRQRGGYASNVYRIASSAPAETRPSALEAQPRQKTNGEPLAPKRQRKSSKSDAAWGAA